MVGHCRKGCQFLVGVSPGLFEFFALWEMGFSMKRSKPRTSKRADTEQGSTFPCLGVILAIDLKKIRKRVRGPYLGKANFRLKELQSF